MFHEDWSISMFLVRLACWSLSVVGGLWGVNRVAAVLRVSGVFLPLLAIASYRPWRAFHGQSSPDGEVWRVRVHVGLQGAGGITGKGGDFRELAGICIAGGGCRWASGSIRSEPHHGSEGGGSAGLSCVVSWDLGLASAR